MSSRNVHANRTIRSLSCRDPLWAGLQNEALERAGQESRVDHRSLERQRDSAMALGDRGRAEELDRAPEVKLGPVVNAIERREAREAEAAGRDYAPVTERGRAVHEAREARRMFAAVREELRERAEAAREAYGQARDDGRDRIGAGLAAMRAALGKERNAPEAGEGVGDRLRRMLGREQARDGGAGDAKPPERDDVRARLDAALGRAREAEERDQAERARVAEERAREEGLRRERGARQRGGWER